MDRDEIEHWMRLPVTQWIISQLQLRAPCNIKAYREASSFENKKRIDGRLDIMSYLEDPLELWRQNYEP